MRIRVPLMIAAGALLLGGCVVRQEEVLPFDYGQDFELPVGSTASRTDGSWANRVVVTFQKVLEDGRCPMNARCVWEGNARIAVQVQRGDAKPSTLELNTSDRFSRTLEAGNVAVTLVHLEPTPMTGEKVKNYVATLKVESGS